MTIQDPGTFVVQCDLCDDEKDFNSTQYADGTFGVDDETLREEGWEIRDGQHLCPDCKNGDEE